MYGGFLTVLYFAQGSILYPGTQSVVARTLALPPGEEMFRVSTALGEVEAVFLPSLAQSGNPKQPLLIFAHGNGEVIDYWLEALDGFRQRGIAVLLVEYPGYGRSTGSPSEASIRAVMDAAYDRAVSYPRVDGTRIMGFGQSLGGGAICLLARDRHLKALILESTFTSLDLFAARYWAPIFLLRDHFDSRSTVAQFRGPVLVIHGRQDTLIPWQEGKQLAAAAKDSVFKLYDCGHGCWDPQRLPFWNDAVPFLVKAGILGTAWSSARGP